MRHLRPAVLLLAAIAVPGCATVRYYAQAAAGQAEILATQRPIRTALRDDATPPVVRERLALTAELRHFAREELALEPSSTYTTYADLAREHVVFIVFATPEFSIEPKSWWYPVVGRQDYRGFFREADARQAARRLREEGFDVHVGGVDAYSTLGWFRDPVLNTFADYPELEYVELIFHELAHHKLFVKGRTDFNEAFATTVAREGVRRWLRARDDSPRLASYRRTLHRRARINAAIASCRQRLARLYASGAAPGAMRTRKAAALRDLRRDLQRLRDSWSAGLTDWLAGDLNNAHLAASATYYELLPGFEELLASCHGDLPLFYRTVKARARQAP